MAMSGTAAVHVQTLARWLTGTDNPPISSEQARDALRALADQSISAFPSGMTADQISDAWHTGTLPPLARCHHLEKGTT